jgi:hypothetical protein
MQAGVVMLVTGDNQQVACKVQLAMQMQWCVLTQLHVFMHHASVFTQHSSSHSLHSSILLHHQVSSSRFVYH